MENQPSSLAQTVVASRNLGRRLLALGENRVELLALEMQEGRERLLQAVLLAVGVAVLVLLAGFALTVALAVFFWETSPVVVLLVLGMLYAGGAGMFYWHLHKLRRDWQILPATLEQLRKDRACLEEMLG